MRPTWVTNQINAFVAQFCEPVTNAWIGAQSRQGLQGVIENGLFRRDGRLEAAPGINLAEGFVWRPTGRGVPELWLSPFKTGYRRAFEAFAKREFGATGLAGADVQIDHVFPKGAGKLGGLGYVRMLAVPPASNMAAGRTLEKAMVARNDDLGPRGKVTRFATYFSIGKATGFDGYERLPDEGSGGNQAVVAALFGHLRRFGLPPAVLGRLDAKLAADRAGDWR
jgi:hypothetical protein